MIIEHNLSLDIANYNNSPLVKIKQYDQNSHQLNISLKNNDVPFSIEAETTAKLRMTKPDGYTVYKNCSIADNIISVVLDGSISTAYGKAPAEIGLYKKEELLLSSTFCINIIKSAIDEGGIIKITVEGTEDQKQVTFSKPISLHGIQSDKGNVVIDGVKYLSDVLGTDNITRHIRYINSYNGEEIGDQWKSSTGQLSTGAEVIYGLSDPVSEPFQEEDVQALKTLKTFYPTSTISAVTNKGESA